MKWRLNLGHSVFTSILRGEKFVFYAPGVAVVSLLCALSSAFAATPPACANSDDTYALTNDAIECKELAFNVPLLESPARLSGPELSEANTATISTSQKIELERLTVLAAQAEAATKASKISKAEQANAAWVLGLLMLHGRGVPADVKRAKYWFQIAWQQGEKKASAGLAWCEMVGCGVPADLAKARYWRAQLFTINRGRSLYFEWFSQQRSAPLAAMNGSGINYDKLPHRSVLLQAANAGDIHAHIELGIESASKKQLDEALKHFLFAEKNSTSASSNAEQIRAEIADLKSLSAVESSSSGINESAASSLALARRYHRGEGIPVNYSEAIRLYKKAADLGSVQAKKMLQLIFSQSSENGAINILWMQGLSQMDVSGSTPKLSSTLGPVLLTREETGLTDFIPQFWNNPQRLNLSDTRPCQPQLAPC
jgi:TPR repeat protein